MTDDRKSGIALIAGACGGILTMAVHPVGAGSITADQAAHLMAASAAVHSLAIVSTLALFLGACGLFRRIAADDRIAFAGIVTYGFAVVATLIATGISGFVVPAMIRRMVQDAPPAASQWRMLIFSIFQVNQAFARILAAATAVAIVLWSVSALRKGGFGRKVAIYGCLAGLLVMLAVGSGQLRMDVRGMGGVVLLQTIWFIIVGAQLCRRTEPTA